MAVVQLPLLLNATPKEFRKPISLHVPSELPTRLEKSLCDLADGAVLDDVHHDLYRDNDPDPTEP
jgi:hypothetical protein